MIFEENASNIMLLYLCIVVTIGISWGIFLKSYQLFGRTKKRKVFK